MTDGLHFTTLPRLVVSKYAIIFVIMSKIGRLGINMGKPHFIQQLAVVVWMYSNLCLSLWTTMTKIHLVTMAVLHCMLQLKTAIWTFSNSFMKTYQRRTLKMSMVGCHFTTLPIMVTQPYANSFMKVEVVWTLKQIEAGHRFILLCVMVILRCVNLLWRL